MAWVAIPILMALVKIMYEWWEGKLGGALLGFFIATAANDQESCFKQRDLIKDALTQWWTWMEVITEFYQYMDRPYHALGDAVKLVYDSTWDTCSKQRIVYDVC